MCVRVYSYSGIYGAYVRPDVDPLALSTPGNPKIRGKKALKRLARPPALPRNEGLEWIVFISSALALVKASLHDQPLTWRGTW